MIPPVGFGYVNAGIVYGQHRGFKYTPVDPLIRPESVVLFGKKPDKDLPSRLKRYKKEAKETVRPNYGAPDTRFNRLLWRLAR